MRKKTQIEFVEEATKIHNGQYTYGNFVYINSRTPGFITCLEHGGFPQSPSNHKKGKGCPKCAGDKHGKDRFSRTASGFVEKATKVHDGFYTYNNFVYAGDKIKSFITCPVHGDFEQTPGDHKQGKGCTVCADGRKGKDAFAKSALEFVEISTKTHAGFYTYENFVYRGNMVKSYVTCPIHGDFLQNPSNHKSGRGCQKCRNNDYSKISAQWLDEIAQENGIFIRHAENIGEFRVPTTNFKADGYCKETNTVYEFHGDCWHGNLNRYKPDDNVHPFLKNKTAKQLYDATIAREEKIKSLGYNLVVIWESEYRNNLANQAKIC
jgi:hypothetical protein